MNKSINIHNNEMKNKIKVKMKAAARRFFIFILKIKSII